MYVRFYYIFSRTIFLSLNLADKLMRNHSLVSSVGAGEGEGAEEDEEEDEEDEEGDEEDDEEEEEDPTSPSSTFLLFEGLTND